MDSSIELLGVAPLGGGTPTSWDATYSLWWNRELGIGGRVVYKDEKRRLRQGLMSTSEPSKLKVRP